MIEKTEVDACSWKALEPKAASFAGKGNCQKNPWQTHLARLYIEPTNQCNLKCRTCVRNTWDEPMGKMSGEVFDCIIEGLDKFSPSPAVIFGGFGEPLFHPHIIDMVASVKALGASVELITNATLLTVEMSKELLAAGLDLLWVSLDGATQETYADIRPGAELPSVLKNIADFRSVLCPENKARLGIVFVAMKRNIADLPNVINIWQHLGAERFMVTNVLPYTREMVGEVLYYYRFDNQGCCPFIERGAAAICWDGNLSPCLPLLHSHVSYMGHLPNEKRFSHRWAIGNVKESSLYDLWNTPAHEDFRARVHTFGFAPCINCRRCSLSWKNEDDCYGNGFPTCGGCMWAQGVIHCP